MSGNTLVYAGAGLLAAEATGVTDLTPLGRDGDGAGGGGGDGGPMFDLPDIALESGGGPQIDFSGFGEALGELAANPGDRLQQEMFDQATPDWVSDVRQRLEDTRETVQNATGGGDGDGGNTTSSSPIGEPTSLGGRVGRGLGELFWQSSVGPLAYALDQNVPGFGGNARDKFNSAKKQVWDDPNAWVDEKAQNFMDNRMGGEPLIKGGGLPDLPGEPGNLNFDPTDDHGAVWDVDVAPEDGTFDPTNWGPGDGSLDPTRATDWAKDTLGRNARDEPAEPSGEPGRIDFPDFSAPDLPDFSAPDPSGGITGDPDTNVIDAGKDRLKGGITGDDETNVIDAAGDALRGAPLL